MAVPGLRLLLTVALAATIVHGCSPVDMAVGAGAATGVAAAQERGIVTSAKDTAISFQIQELWFRTNHEMFGKLSTSVSEGRALITGKVQDPEMRVEAIKLAWQVEGVKEIINEIEVVNSGSMVDSARDFWITTQLRGHITFDKDIRSINYSIDTVNGTVYLMGIARDQAELDRVTNHARNLAYVKRVVSYVRIQGT